MTGRRGALRTFAPLLILVPLVVVALPAARAAPGHLDPSFGAGGRVLGPPAGEINAVAVDGQGRIVVAGKTRFTAGDFLVARYLPTGGLDPSFGAGGVVTTNLGGFDEAFAVAIDGDGILVAGGGGPAGSLSDFAVVRYRADGTLDPGFGVDGKALVPDGGVPSTAYAMAVRDGVVVLAGVTSPPPPVQLGSVVSNIAVARLSSSGAVLGAMTTTQINGNDVARAVVVDADGRVVVAGSTLSSDTPAAQVVLARYTVADGNLQIDPLFGAPGLGFTVGPPGEAAALVQRGDAFVVAGATKRVPHLLSPDDVASARFLLARYTAGGVIDPAFGTAGVVITEFGPAVAFARALVSDDAGRLVAAGGAGGDFALARYAATGSLDPTFGDGGRVTTDFGNRDAGFEHARALAVQTDGRLVAAGTGGLTNEGAFPNVFALARYESSDAAQAGDAVVSLSATPDPVAVDGRLVYTTSVRNTGPGPVYAVDLAQDLSPGAEFEAAVSTQGVCELAGPDMRCDLGGVAPGGVATISATVRPTAAGILVSTARAAPANDAGPGPNSASVAVTVVDAPGEWVASGPLGVGRFNHTATALANGKVLVAGGAYVGDDGVAVVHSSAELYDPLSGSWSPAGSMGTPRTGHTATPLPDGRVLLAGGQSHGGATSPALDSTVIYDPAAASPGQAWSAGPSLATGRVHHAAVALHDGAVLVVAGAGEHAPGHPCRFPDGETESNQRYLRSAEVLRDGGWRPAGCLAHGRSRSLQGTSTNNGNHTATALANGRVLVVGGYRGEHFVDTPSEERMASPELYTPSTNSWSLAAAPAVLRLGHIGVARPDGAVLVAGGSQTNASPTVTLSSEAYRPGADGAGSWTPEASLNRGRVISAEAVLADGSVLVAGGYGERRRVLDTAELYDEAGGWSSAGSMATPRTAHTGSTLPTGPFAACGRSCGAVLVAGGKHDQTRPSTLASTEVYFRQPRVAAVSPGTGPAGGGTTVTITGTGLASAKEVSFAGLPAASFAVDATDPDGRLTAVAPAHAKGVADVVVTTEGGTSATAPAARFAFVDLPGRVSDLAAAALPDSAVRLSFSATDDGTGVRPATRYIVKQSTGPIVDQASFDAAAAVCPVACTFRGLNLVGDPAGLTLRGVEPGFTYRYALRALDAAGNAGPISNVASVTLGDAVGGAGAASGSAAAAGYRLVASDGGVFAFGPARFLGSAGALRLNQPVVAMAATPTGNGYWLAGADGGVFAYGDARFLGSTGGIRLNKAVVAMAATPTGNGYWLVASDGGVFAFGDARFLGSTAGGRLNQPVVGMAATPTGRGYWLAAADGGVFAFGDARFLGSTGGIRLNRPIVAVGASPTGAGYRLAASDGGVFAFGDARFLGSTAALRLNTPIVAIGGSPTGAGYRLVASDGGVFAFGDAPFLGSAGSLRLTRPVVGIS